MRGARVLVPQVLLGLLVLLTNADAQTLPAGAGPEVILARCVSCHDIDLITAQRLSGAGWTREVDKMVRWGATVSDAERATLQSYLVANFGPTPVAAHGSDATGAATYARACLVCHGADLIGSQRLTQAAWSREVDKMVRWGADVGAADKTPLVDFLSARFPQR